MKIGLKGASLVMASALSLLLSGQVAAAAITCDSVDDARYMELTPSEGSASCVGSGSGMPNNESFHEDLGLSEIEKLENAEGSLAGLWFTINGLDATSGSIEFVSNLYDEYSDIQVAFKYGNKHIEPDWMSYSIDGVLSADWEVTRDKALSNVAIWGKSAAQVPGPGALGLMVIGLIGLFATHRSRHPAA